MTSQPNIQNIPIRTEEVAQIREALTLARKALGGEAAKAKRAKREWASAVVSAKAVDEALDILERYK